ncbi:hypothetical protein FSP39_021229 [Pinctada imbricata]|uniref:Uncharacterized protein n=1 Tax=Pinctada imbricata TaxID=66713 RepID=A0AA89BRM9_PINIB|nr:hypothetical protein FSP39_021229 [Pinctada imbricata]
MDLRFGCTCIQVEDSTSENAEQETWLPEMRTKEYSLKIIMLGDPGVGKTTLLDCYCNRNKYNENKPARFDRRQLLHEERIRRGNDNVNLRIMDTGGQERYRSITASYFRHAHGCIFVFDLSNRKSMENITMWFKDLKMYVYNADCLTNILVGTLFKKPKREVTYEEGLAYAEYLDMPYVEILSRDSGEIETIFETVADKIVEKIKTKVAAISTHTNIQDVRNLGKVYGKAKESLLSCQC